MPVLICLLAVHSIVIKAYIVKIRPIGFCLFKVIFILGKSYRIEKAIGHAPFFNYRFYYGIIIYGRPLVDLCLLAAKADKAAGNFVHSVGIFGNYGRKLINVREYYFFGCALSRKLRSVFLIRVIKRHTFVIGDSKILLYSLIAKSFKIKLYYFYTLFGNFLHIVEGGKIDVGIYKQRIVPVAYRKVNI